MINKADEQQDIETEYFDRDQSGNGWAPNHQGCQGEETTPPILIELLEDLATVCKCTYAALSIGRINPCPSSTRKAH